LNKITFLREKWFEINKKNIFYNNEKMFFYFLYYIKDFDSLFINIDNQKLVTVEFFIVKIVKSFINSLYSIIDYNFDLNNYLNKFINYFSMKNNLSTNINFYNYIFFNKNFFKKNYKFIKNIYFFKIFAFEYIL